MDVTGQSQITYAYDNADRLTSLTQGTSVVSFGYDEVNRRTSLTLPNGIVTEYGYNAASQLTALTYTLSGSTIGSLTYGYDATGQRRTVGGSWARTNLPAALASATYDANNEIVTWGNTAFTYDANGSLTSDGTNTYTWNARDQLASVTGSTGGSFVYDGVWRRRVKSVSGSQTAFVYDGLNPVQERVSGSATANILTGLRVDEFFTRFDGDGASHFLPDVLGTPLALADSSGAVQTEYTYEPFGMRTAAGSPSSNRIGFTGRELDETGLYFFRTRYYAPSQQRFLRPDPIGFGGMDSNLFAFVQNSPTNLVDPTGECPACVAAGIAVLESAAVRAALSALLAAATAAAEAASNRRLNEYRCDRQYEEDVKRCKQCDPEQRRECYKQAMERWVACRTGRDIPPLFPDEPWLRSK
jgi:RHS repeat-associated protein